MYFIVHAAFVRIKLMMMIGSPEFAKSSNQVILPKCHIIHTQTKRHIMLFNPCIDQSL